MELAPVAHGLKKIGNVRFLCDPQNVENNYSNIIQHLDVEPPKFSKEDRLRFTNELVNNLHNETYLAKWGKIIKVK